MRPAALLLLLLPASCATAPPSPDAIELAFRRFDEIQRPFATWKAEDFERLPNGYESVVSLLPAGYWGLLIDAYPDRAFERYAPRFEKDDDDAIVPRWALVRLAERGHRPTLDFFRGRLDHGDRYQRGLAVRMLAHSGDASLAPELLRRIPAKIGDGDDSELAHDILAAVAGFRPVDPAVLEPFLKRFSQDGGWIVGESILAQFAVARAADPAAAASRFLRVDEESNLTMESYEEWLPEFALRQRLTALAPVLRRRVQLEIDKYRKNDDEKALRPGEAQLPQRDAFWGFRGAFLLARYRSALRDLGLSLTPEERDWLESQRLLRPPREYLVEAGLLPQ